MSAEEGSDKRPVLGRVINDLKEITQYSPEPFDDDITIPSEEGLGERSSLEDETREFQLPPGFAPRPEAPPIPLRELVGASDRYEIGETIGSGGSGVVREAHDRFLDRKVAIKVLERDATLLARRQRFLLEARTTASMSHPNIVSIHDVIELESGKLGYVMELVEGHTLTDIIKWVYGHDDAPDLASLGEPPGFARLMQWFSNMCSALARAHDQGLVHRDLKPNNVIVTGVDEVVLLDWGLAVRAGSTSHMFGEKGLRVGHAYYAAPEYLVEGGVQVTTRGDVYSLGVVLYYILMGRFVHNDVAGPGWSDYFRYVRSRPPRVDDAQVRWDGYREDLGRLCERALALDPAERFADATELHHAVRAWIEGSAELARRQQEVEQGMKEAARAGESYRRVVEELEETRRELFRRGAWRTPAASAEERRRYWDLEEKLAQAGLRREQLFAEWGAILTRARRRAPRGEERPRMALLESYSQRVLEAEREGRALDMARYRALLKPLDVDGAAARWLDAPGEVRIDGAIEGGRIARMEEQDRTFTAAEWMALEVGAWKELGPGVYLAEVRFQSGLQGTYPIHITRHARLELELVPPSTLPTGFVWIPAGAYLTGGDEAFKGVVVPRESVHLPAYAIARYPTTNGEYLAFVNALVAQGREGRAKAMVPVDIFGNQIWQRSAQGYVLPEADADGHAWGEDQPVVCITQVQAEGYCAWLAEELRRPVRLLQWREWEKAARGTDGRIFPWGNETDFSHGCNRYSLRQPGPNPVGSFPTDCSPYGVRDLAGNIYELIQSEPGDPDQYCRIAGGAWVSGIERMRCTRSFQKVRGRTNSGTGFRVGFSLET